MRIAIASGKGGTGKTTVAVNLALAASWAGYDTTYVDCDVEEPNGDIFLKPNMISRHPVTRSYPCVNEAVCLHCGQCSDICRFSAIVSSGQTLAVFPELCHECGGCYAVCPVDALHESKRVVGTVTIGKRDALMVLQGSMKIGESMSPPVIRVLKNHIPTNNLVILDAAPGTSCTVVECLHDCDAALLVTEPTPFGLHDLQLAIELVRRFHIPYGVIINRSNAGTADVLNYCQQEDVPILFTIPNDPEIAKWYSQGELLIEQSQTYKTLFLHTIGVVLTLKDLALPLKHSYESPVLRGAKS